MKKVKFEIGWRLYSLIIGLLILIGYLGFSYAYGGTNPSVMGHTASEIEGLENLDFSKISVSAKECAEKDLVYHSGVKEKKGVTMIELPKECFTIKGCKIVKETYQKSENLQEEVFDKRWETVFSINPRNMWTSSIFPGQQFYKGSYHQEKILPGDSLLILDEYDNLKPTSSSQIVVIDEDSNLGAKIYIC